MKIQNNPGITASVLDDGETSYLTLTAKESGEDNVISINEYMGYRNGYTSGMSQLRVTPIPGLQRVLTGTSGCHVYFIDGVDADQPG